jgi:hypothetical protein
MAKREQTAVGYLTFSELISKRRWTRRLVTRLLGEPDITEPRWQYGSLRTVRLYKLGRVEEAERGEAFAQAQEGFERRREIGRRAIASRWSKTFRALEACPVKVPQLSRDDLIERAVLSDMSVSEALEELDRAADDENEPDSLAAECVDYLQAELVEYDRSLAKGQKAAAIVQRRVLEAIAEAYPWLEKECRRRMERGW